MFAGSGCYGALARRINLNAFCVALYRKRASVSCNAYIWANWKIAKRRVSRPRHIVAT